MGKFGWSYPPGAANDPFAPYNQEPDFGLDLEELRDALKAHDTGRWDWEKIDCTLTGKDADLEPWGCQGIELVSCDEDKIVCIAHVLKAVAGTGVYLNLEPEIEQDDARTEAAYELYLDEAELVVQECSLKGEWDGDSWILLDSETFEIEWDMDGTDPDYEKTAQSVVDGAEEALRHFDEELDRMNDILNLLSGWIAGHDENGKLIHCRAGEPSKYAVWRSQS